MSNTVKTHMNKATLDDVVASFLYSIGSVNDNQDIKNIKIGRPNKEGLVPISYEVVEKA